MRLFGFSFTGALWEKDTEVFSNLEKNHTDLRSPFLEPKLRIAWTREHLWMYNAVLCLFLFVIWLLRTVRVLRRRRKCYKSANTRDTSFDGTSSDSSSTLTGTATPPEVLKSEHDDDEHKPLLQRTQNGRYRAWGHILRRRLRGFLMYQPQPLPYIGKVLPDNGTTLFVLGFVFFNFILASVHIPFESRMWLVFSDRCASLFAANLPLLYLLAAKNQPLKRITGYSYEALNIFHRRLGEMMCLFAFLHMASSFYIYFSMVKPILRICFWRFVNNRLILCGICALICYEALYLTSLSSFRKRRYELFLVLHVMLQVGGLGFLWFHYFSSRVYVLTSVVLFVVDRLVYRLILKSTSVEAGLEVLEDGETVMLSAHWAITNTRPLVLGRHCVRNGWRPAEHVFITIPALSSSAILQAHPFTVASAAPDMTASMPHAWFSILIRSHGGFSRDLLNYARQHRKVNVRIDGPYGTPEPLHMLEDSDHAIVVAGGSGIAVVFPLAWSLLQPLASDFSSDGPRPGPRRKGKQRKVSLIWIIHSASHLSWIPRDYLDELTDLGLHVRIPPPTATYGRPNVGLIVEDMVHDDWKGGRAGVVVSGPDALNRDVRNACSRLVDEGFNVELTVEKFGW
ncbi:uncharacterized protein PV09_02275 [Verruconis gallopava]|uniref:FAD-binding FR-type domain-containing protein n=1 Tax=Verruconis gallopava TaxID=253628 RepID=A0A0D2ALR9_9PEZI|nr:uncharacterized protein PV09_02275 [Verruconis gallopava]KIW07435.1 hypothetical protein PV09_02275 [Verruconis gallopava]